MKAFEHFIRFQLPAFGWAAFIYGLSSIPGPKLPNLSFELTDKLGHAIVFFVLGVLVYRALEPPANSSKFSWVRVVVSVSLVIIYGITDEIHQGFVPGRTQDVFDVAADTIGGFLAAIVVYLMARRRQMKQSQA